MLAVAGFLRGRRFLAVLIVKQLLEVVGRVDTRVPSAESSLCYQSLQAQGLVLFVCYDGLRIDVTLCKGFFWQVLDVEADLASRYAVTRIKG